MIDELDSAMAAFFADTMDAGATVSFDTPNATWSAAPKQPILSCFLYDIVEDVERRSADWMDERGDDGRVTGRRPPTRHYRVRYLISAWAPTAAQEHALLASVMRATLAVEAFSPEHLTGSLALIEEPVWLSLAAPLSDRDVRPHEIWSSLAMPMRPSLTILVRAALRPVADTDIAAAAEEITLGMQNVDRVVTPVDPVAAARAARTWTAFRVRENAGEERTCRPSPPD